MASIIKKEIRIPEGTLKEMCKEHQDRTGKLMNIGILARKIVYNGDTLRKFNKGDRPIKFEIWEKIGKILN